MSPMRSIVRLAMQQLAPVKTEWGGDPLDEQESLNDGTNQPDN